MAAVARHRQYISDLARRRSMERQAAEAATAASGGMAARERGFKILWSGANDQAQPAPFTRLGAAARRDGRAAAAQPRQRQSWVRAPGAVPVAVARRVSVDRLDTGPPIAAAARGRPRSPPTHPSGGSASSPEGACALQPRRRQWERLPVGIVGTDGSVVLASPDAPRRLSDGGCSEEEGVEEADLPSDRPQGPTGSGLESADVVLMAAGLYEYPPALRHDESECAWSVLDSDDEEGAREGEGGPGGDPAQSA